jgi:hypothetical protein
MGIDFMLGSFPQKSLATGQEKWLVVVTASTHFLLLSLIINQI